MYLRMSLRNRRVMRFLNRIDRNSKSLTGRQGIRRTHKDSIFFIEMESLLFTAKSWT
jgi:hypothetical protein